MFNSAGIVAEAIAISNDLKERLDFPHNEKHNGGVIIALYNCRLRLLLQPVV